MMYKFLLVIGLVMAFALTATAQGFGPDTVKNGKNDTLKKASNTAPGSFAPPIKKEKAYHPDSLHSPHKAVMHSLMIPGWGQLYNHSWWKVPIIYGGIGLLVSAVIFNQKYYNQDIAIYNYRKQGIAPKPGQPYYAEYNLYAQYNVPDASIISEMDSYRRNRDLSILGILAAWGIQTVEAYIDAKFIHSYTVDNNLGMNMKISPGLINQPLYAQSANSSYIPSIKITFTF
jgi:hypothetical protein